MKAKYYYAAPIFSNIPKVMVLTQDGVLYTEYQEYDVLHVERKDQIDFDNFSPVAHECEDYPVWLPITYHEAKEMEFAGQPHWLNRYLTEKKVDITPAPIALHA